MSKYIPKPNECYHNCYLYLLYDDRDQHNWNIVHGEVGAGNGPGSGLKHAWLENEAVVWDLTPPFDYISLKDNWYKDYNVVAYNRYSFEEANKLALKTHHTGPWEPSWEYRMSFQNKEPDPVLSRYEELI